MDTVDPLRFIAALLFVIGLIGAVAFLFKRYAPAYMGVNKDIAGRIHILETRYIDPKRKLVLIRRDQMEHLLLCADGRETVIESGITPLIESPSMDKAKHV